MPVVKLPNGQAVQFPDDMPMAEIKALIEHKFPKEVGQLKAKAAGGGALGASTVKTDQNGQIVPVNPMAQGTAPVQKQGDLPGQIMSGVNIGLGGMLSFPNKVAQSFESIGPTIVNALGGHAAMPPDSGYAPDAGKAYTDMSTSIGAIHPPTADPVEQFGRKAGEYVGASILPGMGPVAEAPTLLKAIGTGAKELIGATGAGLGAATANAVAPDNPVAELAGATIGGGLTVGGLRGARQAAEAKAGPSIESLKTDSGKLYQTAEARGVVASPVQAKSIASDMNTIARNEEIISPTGRFNNSYPKIVEAVKTFNDYASSGTAISVKQLQAIRQKLTDAAGSTEPGEQRIAMKMLQKFDGFTDPLAPELQQANAIYHRAMNAERIDTQIALAKSDAGDLTGAGYENALRRRFQQLERGIEKGTEIGFSPEEIDAIKKVAHGGPLQLITRWAGKFAPTGVVSAGMTGTLAGGAAGAVGLPVIPVALGVAGTGIGGRLAATAIRSGNAQRASALSRRGPGKMGPSLTPSEAVPLATSAATAMNDNSPSLQLSRFRNVGNALRMTH